MLDSTGTHVRTFAGLIALLWTGSALAQESYACANDAPNAYAAGESFAALPGGRLWGSTAGVAIAPEGNIWAYDRCAANSCAESDLDPIVEFARDGTPLRSFGAGLLLFPHGLTVDRDGNVWVTDAQALGDKGQQVFKFSPDGELLLTLGTAGVADSSLASFNQPTAVAIAPSGDVFVAEGHSPNYGNSRIMHFSADGTFIKTFGTLGSGPGQLMGPHALAFDSAGRLFVADRSNNRIAIFGQDGTFLAAWTQFGRPSGVFIDANDVLYVADSESQSADATRNGFNPNCGRGIRIGSAVDGRVTGFIPDPNPRGGTSGAEGVAVDAAGNVYGAEVGSRDLKIYRTL